MSVDPQTFYEGVKAPTASDPVDAEGQAPPVSPSTASEPEQQEAPEVDYRALSEQYQKQAEFEQQQRAMSEAKLNKVETGLQQMASQQQEQQRQTEYQNRIREMTARANTMRQDDAERYIQNETQNIISELQKQTQAERRQAAQREQAIVRQLGAPLYIEKLVKENNLPAEARARLEAFGDPDLAERIGVPMLKEQYQQKKDWEDRLKQASRSQKANQMASSGLNRLGGNNPPGTPTFDVPEHLTPEQRAAWIYDNVIHGE